MANAPYVKIPLLEVVLDRHADGTNSITLINDKGIDEQTYQSNDI